MLSPELDKEVEEFWDTAPWWFMRLCDLSDWLHFRKQRRASFALAEFVFWLRRRFTRAARAPGPRNTPGLKPELK